MMNKGIAVITGGSRGIGEYLVRAFVEEGYFVEFTYLNSLERALKLEKNYNGKCRSNKVDGSNANEVEGFVKKLCTEKNKISVLVNNAGLTKNFLAKDGTWESFQSVINTNFGGVFNFSTMILPVMMRQKYGNIINISTLATKNVRLGNSLYASSKVAIERFTESLALEGIRFNVTANSISPGFVETELVEEMLKDEKLKRDLLRAIPTRRFTKPAEIAEMAVFLASRKPLLVGTNTPLGGGGHL